MSGENLNVIFRSADPSRYRFCAVVSHKNPSWAYCDHVDEGLDSIHCVPQINNSMTISKLRYVTSLYYFIFYLISLINYFCLCTAILGFPDSL